MPGLFSRSSRVPIQWPRSTINGRPQHDPQGPNSLQRRYRLFVERIRRIADDPLAVPSAQRTPIGDGVRHGRAGRPRKPAMRSEAIAPEVGGAARSATDLHIVTVDRTSLTVPFAPAVETAMGVGNVAGPGSAEPVFDVTLEWAAQLFSQQRDARDGTDWTERARTNDGQETTSRLRPPEPQPSRATRPARPAGRPTVEQILAEWTPGPPAADLARWREGMARYDAAPVENRAEMRASAELMCAALVPLPSGQQHSRRIARHDRGPDPDDLERARCFPDR